MKLTKINDLPFYWKKGDNNKEAVDLDIHISLHLWYLFKFVDKCLMFDIGKKNDRLTRRRYTTFQTAEACEIIVKDIQIYVCFSTSGFDFTDIITISW